MALSKALKTLLESFASGRVYAMQLPQHPEFPAIVYQRISGTRAGPLWRPRYQISCWSRSYKEAEALAGSVTAGLHGYQGDLDGVEGVLLVSSDGLDTYEPDTGLYRRILDLQLYHW